ncbi:sigma factor-like helix-turn-helix DNA-binding protein [Streptomyces sp. NPDC048484]|uniref:sigma factor-like helix-turn-helix DNA-binding protein n=1 Tax=Streptomyces sp. NPDC048484 TaxID=3155146 RepID=UPI00344AA1C7
MDDDFTARAGEYWPRLTRTALLLTGDSADADRRARAALAEVYARRRVPGGDAEFYVRRALVRGFLRRRPRPLARFGFGSGSGSRRASRRGFNLGFGFGSGIGSEQASEPYAPDPLDPLTEVLAGLPPRRRTVAVLQHWDGLPRHEVAALLNSSPGTVKAVGRRAEKALRAHPAYREGPNAGNGPVPGPTPIPAPIPVPVPIPIPAIKEAGLSRRRQRRRTTALLTSVGALLLVPLVFGVVRGTASGAGAGSGTVSVSVEGAAVRVVTPGERVTAAPGVEFWLTKDGTHWSAPGQPNRFRDSGEEGEDPGLTVRADSTSGKRIFLSGVHRGTREAARVELVTPEGTFTARVLTLAGSPGWSAWYADAQLTVGEQSLPGITVKAYDSAGKLLAQTDSPARTDTPS